MPTATQVANRALRQPSERHYTATVIAAGPPVLIALDPGGGETTALALDGAAYIVNQRVLVLTTSSGNYLLGRIA